eukprot:1147571-Pelagomonas_calceolata.AAC.5
MSPAPVILVMYTANGVVGGSIPSRGFWSSGLANKRMLPSPGQCAQVEHQCVKAVSIELSQLHSVDRGIADWVFTSLVMCMWIPHRIQQPVL